MKRKEILGRIYDILYRETPLEEWECEALTTEILNDLEYSGMRPPALNNEPKGEWEKDEERKN